MRQADGIAAQFKRGVNQGAGILHAHGAAFFHGYLLMEGNAFKECLLPVYQHLGPPCRYLPEAYPVGHGVLSGGDSDIV